MKARFLQKKKRSNKPQVGEINNKAKGAFCDLFEPIIISQIEPIFLNSLSAYRKAKNL